jgi:hypothetical protein
MLSESNPVNPVVSAVVAATIQADAIQTAREIFEGQTHLEPVTLAVRAFGWAESTASRHINKNTYPIKRDKIGKRFMVSRADFVRFLLRDLEEVATAPTTIEVNSKRSRGRPTNKEQAVRKALVQIGGV